LSRYEQSLCHKAVRYFFSGKFLILNVKHTLSLYYGHAASIENLFPILDNLSPAVGFFLQERRNYNSRRGAEGVEKKLEKTLDSGFTTTKGRRTVFEGSCSIANSRMFAPGEVREFWPTG
jgi:hypothetical protein